MILSCAFISTTLHKTSDLQHNCLRGFFDPSYAVPPYTAVSITVCLRWLFANTIGRTVDGESVPVPDQASDGHTRQTDGVQPYFHAHVLLFTFTCLACFLGLKRCRGAHRTVLRVWLYIQRSGDGYGSPVHRPSSRVRKGPTAMGRVRVWP